MNNIFGRRIHFRSINDKNFSIRSFQERAAINAPIQGSAADIIKRAMIVLSKNNKLIELETKMLLQVHDELIFETKKENSSKAMKIIKEEMENAHNPILRIKVPLIADTSFGKNWDEAH